MSWKFPKIIDIFGPCKIIRMKYCLKILLKAIAQCVKKVRLSKNLSQEEVYLDTEIHCGRLEQGKQNVTVCTLKRLCDYFQISLSDFFKEIEEQEHSSH